MVESVAVAIVGAVELTTSSNSVGSSGAVAEEYPSQLFAAICTSFHDMEEAGAVTSMTNTISIVGDNATSTTRSAIQLVTERQKLISIYNLILVSRIQASFPNVPHC